MLEYDSVGQVDDVVPVPWGGERVVRFLHPLWAKYPIAVTQELNRGRAKGCPMAGMLPVLVPLSPPVTDLSRTGVLCVGIPTLPDISNEPSRRLSLHSTFV